MKIEWNKVTGYSKLLALLLFIGLPFLAFCLGVFYQKNIDTVEKTTNTGLYSNSCKAGEVGLFEGGVFTGCVKPTTRSETGNTEPKTTQPPVATRSSNNQTNKTYPNPCGADEVVLYEGGELIGCAKPSQ